MNKTPISKAAAALGRAGGKTSTAAKQAAARKNGALGGRPGVKFWTAANGSKVDIYLNDDCLATLPNDQPLPEEILNALETAYRMGCVRGARPARKLQKKS